MKKFLIIFLILLFAQIDLTAFADNKYYIIELPNRSGTGTYTITRQKNIYVKNRFSKPRRCCARKRIKSTNAEIHERTKYRLELRKAYRNAKIVNTMTPQKTTPSRFNKNYHINSNTRKISCNGVTYYGNMNACK